MGRTQDAHVGAVVPDGGPLFIPGVLKARRRHTVRERNFNPEQECSIERSVRGLLEALHTLVLLAPMHCAASV
jgi:hypothetical protein